MYNDNRTLIKVAGMIIIAIAAITLLVPLIGTFVLDDFGTTITIILLSLPAVFSLAVGILGTKETSMPKRLLIVLGAINILVLPTIKIVAIFNIATISQDSGRFAIAILFLPFVFMFLLFVGFVANVMFLVGAIKDIKAVN